MASPIDNDNVPEFRRGDYVRKKTGEYEFVSYVVAVFTKLDGQTRMVCESVVIPGLLHIFSPKQMELARDGERPE